MYALIPLLLALMISTYARGAAAGPFPVRHLVWMGMALCAWGFLLGLLAQVLRRRGRNRSLPRFELLGSVTLLCLHGWWTYALGWPPWDWTLLAILPFVLGLAILWWHLAGLVRATTGTDQHAGGFVWLRLKLGILPLVIAIALLDPGEWLLLRSLWLLEGLPPWLAWLLLQAAVVVLLVAVGILVPPLLVLAWGARPLPAGHQRDLVEAAIRRSGVTVRRVLHWPTGRGRLFNAAAIGLVARLRYVLMTDRLLESLADDELRGVLGHELGHIRRRHLQLYFVFIITASIWALVATPWLVALAVLVPGATALDPGLLEGLGALAAWALMLGLGFGALSRACERQADLEGVALCEDPRTMQAALAAVARVTGMDPETPSWRHHSIADRIAFLERARLDPHQETRHHRRVMKLRTVIWFFLILGLILVLAQAAGTRVGLGQQVTADPDLNRALLTAVEEDDYDLLQRWIGSRESFERAAYARSILGMFIEYRFAADERKLRAYVPYLMPFRRVSTGDEALDRELQNTIAYALAAGSAPPSPEDLAVLEGMLGGLVAAQERAAKEQHESLARLSDTIGCILFVLGRHQEAADYFKQAIDSAAKGPAPELPTTEDAASPTRAETLQLIKARLDACEREAALLPRYWGGIVE